MQFFNSTLNKIAVSKQCQEAAALMPSGYKTKQNLSKYLGIKITRKYFTKQ